MVARRFLCLYGWYLKIRDSKTYREPIPHNRTRIRIGDVGVICEGQFNFLFHTGPRPEERQPGADVPSTFEPLIIEEPRYRLPRPDDHLCAGSVQETGINLDATISATTYVSSLRPPSNRLQNVLDRLLRSDAGFSFKLTGKRGAALVTRYPTYIEDIQVRQVSEFRAYVERHHSSWVMFACDKGYLRGVHWPVLVTGIDVTKDVAMMAYSNENYSLTAQSVTEVRHLSASASIRLAVTRSENCSPHFHQWPVRWNDQPRDFPPPLQMEPPDDFEMGVFIRYYIGCPRVGGWLPLRVMKAGAGPHDLGPGDNRGDALPELTVQSDAEPPKGTSGDSGGQSDFTGDSDSESITVVSNVQSVWVLVTPFVSALTFVCRVRHIIPGASLQSIYSR